MIASLDRHFKKKGYSLSIVRDGEFFSSKQVLDGKAKQLRLAGRGKRLNKGRQLYEEEEEILWKSEKLGAKNPESLIHTMWVATYPRVWPPWEAGTPRNETGGFQNHER